MFTWCPDYLARIRDWPHLMGHMVGKSLLTSLHSDWCKMIWDAPGGQHCSLMAHRGAYKTTAITEIGILYYLLFHPNDRIALIRETWTESVKTLETIKNYMKTEAIQSLFAYAHGKPPIPVKSPAGSVTYSFKRSITKEGSIDAYGINQVPTGSHYDRIICDDIVTINSRLSRARREAVKQGVLEIMTNIVDPGKSCFFVGTPWHYDDAWSMKNDDGELIIPEAWKYRPQDTNILTPAQLEAKRKTTTASLFAINYMLDTSVRDEGQIFDEPHYADWDHSLLPTRVHSHVDAAWDGACTNALTIMAKDPITGRIHAYGKMYPGNIQDCLADIVQTCGAYKSRDLRLEDNADKKMLAKEFMKVPGAPRVSSYHEAMNKDIKIACYLKKYWNAIDWDPRTDPNYMMQVLDYRPGQDPRDCADSAASLLREVFYKTDSAKGHGSLYD